MSDSTPFLYFLYFLILATIALSATIGIFFAIGSLLARKTKEQSFKLLMKCFWGGIIGGFLGFIIGLFIGDIVVVILTHVNPSWISTKIISSIRGLIAFLIFWLIGVVGGGIFGGLRYL